MPNGFARILKVGPQYQFIYNSGGNSYSRVFDEPKLIELMNNEMGLEPEIVNQALTVVRRDGHVTISDVELSENNAAAFGLQEVGSDY